MLITARSVVPVYRPPINNGGVVVGDGRIIDVGSARHLKRKYNQSEIHDLGNVVLMPGLVNAHCHLDYTLFHRKLPKDVPFSEWILEIVRLKKRVTPAQYIKSIQTGAFQALRTGTTSMVNIESFPELIPRVKLPQIRMWWALELIDRNVGNDRTLLQEVIKVYSKTKNPLWTLALSPHAPYTATAKMFRMCAELSLKKGLLFTTHLAESKEELEMFLYQTGFFYGITTDQGGNSVNLKGRYPLETLSKDKMLPRRALLAHMNFTTKQDVRIMQKARHSIVHCPRCHAYFNRSKFPYAKFKEAGINVCLGTDSLASNDSLNMFEEMQTFARTHPRLAADEILAMTTHNAAIALNKPGQLGVLKKGAFADMIALDLNVTAEKAVASIVDYSGFPLLTWIGGQEIKTVLGSV